MIGSVLFAPNSQVPAGQKSQWLSRSIRKSDHKNKSNRVGVSRLGVFRLFQGLDTEAIAEISQSCLELSVDSGSIVIRQGQVGKEIYLLENGSVAIYVESGETARLIGELQAPSVFGEMAIKNPERIRTANVAAVTDLNLLTIPIPAYLSFLRRFAALRENQARLVAERAATVSNR